MCEFPWNQNKIMYMKGHLNYLGSVEKGIEQLTRNKILNILKFLFITSKIILLYVTNNIVHKQYIFCQPGVQSRMLVEPL